MRIRTIKPQFFTDEKVRKLPYGVRLFFIGLLCFADDTGRFEDDPHLIKAMLFPSDEVNVPQMLANLQENRMIKSYKSRGTRYYSITNFHRHQVINRPSAPRTPPPRGRRPSRKRHGNTHGAFTPKDGLEREQEREQEQKSVCQSAAPRAPTEQAPVEITSPGFHTRGDNSRPGAGSSKTRGDSERTTDRASLEILQSYFPEAALERLKAQFPPERLLWAAQRTAGACERRKVKKPASYLLRILRDDEQWERYLCDRHALGKEEALRRERHLAAQSREQREKLEKQKRASEEDAFQKYLQTVPEEQKAAITEEALAKWASESGIDLEYHRKQGWLLKRSIQGLYEARLRRIYLAHEKPSKFAPAHLNELLTQMEEVA